MLVVGNGREWSSDNAGNRDRRQSPLNALLGHACSARVDREIPGPARGQVHGDQMAAVGQEPAYISEILSYRHGRKADTRNTSPNDRSWQVSEVRTTASNVGTTSGSGNSNADRDNG